MNHLLDKTSYKLLLESIKCLKDSLVYIHHPITEDLIIVKIKQLLNDKVMVSILEDSPYYGQPDFIINKTKIVGII